MKSVRSVQIVVVGDSDHAAIFAARLHRMDLGEVTTVAGLDEAGRNCRSGGADVCLVVNDDFVPDARPIRGEAPGRGCGVPTLMVVAAVTPGLRKLARRAGYSALVPAAIPPRLLYRRIRAVLQGRRRADPPRRRLPPGPAVTHMAPARSALAGKPTLH